jgi:hypothetical protein
MERWKNIRTRDRETEASNRIIGRRKQEIR